LGILVVQFVQFVAFAGCCGEVFGFVGAATVLLLRILLNNRNDTARSKYFAI
jgi:hypothetical protein